jgi:hypothetical protein
MDRFLHSSEGTALDNFGPQWVHELNSDVLEFIATGDVAEKKIREELTELIKKLEEGEKIFLNA